MRGAWVACGLVGIAGTTTLALSRTFRSFDVGPPARRNALAGRLEPVDEGDMAWLGVYRLFTRSEECELEPDGRYRARFASQSKGMVDSDYWCGNGRTGRLVELEEKTGSWRLSGGDLVLQPDAVAPPMEFQLGLLDGDYVLLTEFCTWRRVPDVAATSSSR